MVFSALIFANAGLYPIFYGFIALFGFFGVNQQALSVSIAIQTLKIKNISFVNAIFFITAQFISFSGQTAFSYLVKRYSQAGEVYLCYIGTLLLISLIIGR